MHSIRDRARNRCAELIAESPGLAFTDAVWLATREVAAAVLSRDIRPAELFTFIDAVVELAHEWDIEVRKASPLTALTGNVGSATPVPRVNWLNMKGPVADGLDVTELTSLELKHRRAIWNNIEKVRQKAGNTQAYVLETAPQMGVRLTRLLGGVKKLSLQEIKSGATFKDVIGYCGTYANNPEFQIPYGCLVPAKLENVLAAGRCISAEYEVADITRLIPVCWATGQAAGIAAALCIKDKCKPRSVNVTKLQNLLRQQGAYLG